MIRLGKLRRLNMVKIGYKREEAMSQRLVLLHGWGLNRAVWDTITPLLSPHFAVDAVNIPGFGGAPWHPDYSTIEAVADKLAADIAQSHSEPVVLLGWSLGGLLGTLIARRHPHLVRRLHTIASSPCFVAQPDSGWPGIDKSILSAFQTQLSGDFEATLKRFMAVQAMGSPSARADMKILQASVLAQPPADLRALAAGLAWLAKTDLRDTLARLPMPLYRAYGRLDTLVPVAVAEQILPGTSKVFEHSAHAPFLNQPGEFCAWLKEGLSEV